MQIFEKIHLESALYILQNAKNTCKRCCSWCTTAKTRVAQPKMLWGTATIILKNTKNIDFFEKIMSRITPLDPTERYKHILKKMFENIFEIFLMFYPSLHSCPSPSGSHTRGTTQADVIYKGVTLRDTQRTEDKFNEVHKLLDDGNGMPNNLPHGVSISKWGHSIRRRSPYLS